MKVVILGAGKVGRTLARAARRAGLQVTLRSARRGPPARAPRVDLWILAVRDGQLADWAGRLARARCVVDGAAVVHLAGAMGPEVLEPLSLPRALSPSRGESGNVAIGQMHPMLSFADARRPPDLAGAHALVAGDELAIRRARSFCKSVGLVPRVWEDADLALYHAAGAVLANGAAALGAVAGEALKAAGAPPGDIGAVLGPLLRSVADNIEHLGLPQALTGPIRRGDAATVTGHLRQIKKLPPASRALYRAAARKQIEMAEVLGDATRAALDATAVVLRSRRSS